MHASAIVHLRCSTGIASRFSAAAGRDIARMQVGVQRTSWLEVLQDGGIDEARFKQDSEECCHVDELDWGNLRCNMQSFMQPNYTARFLSAGQAVLSQGR